MDGPSFPRFGKQLQLFPHDPEAAIDVRLSARYSPVPGTLSYVLAVRHSLTNELLEVASHSYDRWHVGMAPLDLVARLVDVFGFGPDPFP